MSIKTATCVIFYLITGVLVGAHAEIDYVANAEQTLTERRHALVRQVEQHVRETASYLGRNTLDPRVIRSLSITPRHEFVPPALIDWAYEDRPLPIGADQTISQPYIVAIMTDLLELDDDCRVLDVGTGSGYQAAILASLCKQVWSIEIIPSLGRAAADKLARLGYTNIEVRIGDGFAGWPEKAPFDGIIVAATGDELPPPLLAQLKPGGRIVMPLRNRAGGETLVVAYKQPDGRILTTDILPVRFVPLTRGKTDDTEVTD
jgi:protein-L-isoaspartate(D-aspartate) O-methyltransferase